MSEKTRTQEYHLRIQSRKRDKSIYPSSSNYSVPISGISGRHIKAIHLLNYAIPSSMYNIGTKNNFIKLLEGFGSTSATIPPGNYNPNQLADAIMTANASITCTYDSLTGRFTIKLVSNQPILPAQNVGLAPIMGFDLVEDFANFKVSHTSENVANLSRPPILFLRINDYVSGVNVGEDRSTLAIYNNAGFGDILIGSGDTYSLSFYSHGGVPVFNEVAISFVDEKARPIEFNGAEHTLELCFIVERPAYNK